MLKITFEAENINRDEFNEALALVEGLVDFDPPTGTVLAKLLDDAVAVVEAYENEHYPI